MQSATLKRILTGVPLAGGVFALIWLPALEPFFVVAVAAFAFLGLREYFTLAHVRGLDVHAGIGTMAGFCVVLSTYTMKHSAPCLMLLAGIFALAAMHIFYGPARMDALAAGIFGIIYVGWMPAHFTLLRGIAPAGPGLVTLCVASVVLCDTGAYFAGRAFGRHKLAPSISPNKTKEGAIGGVLLALAGGAVMWMLHARFEMAGLPAWNLFRYMAAAFVLAIASEMGDLVESMLKRDAGVKDAGRLFPGHGGVLDRCDGFIFAAPALYYLVTW